MGRNVAIVVTVMERDGSSLLNSDSEIRELKHLGGKSVFDATTISREAALAASICVRRMQDAKDSRKDQS